MRVNQQRCSTRGKQWNLADNDNNIGNNNSTCSNRGVVESASRHQPHIDANIGKFHQSESTSLFGHRHLNNFNSNNHPHHVPFSFSFPRDLPQTTARPQSEFAITAEMKKKKRRGKKKNVSGNILHDEDIQKMEKEMKKEKGDAVGSSSASSSWVSSEFTTGQWKALLLAYPLYGPLCSYLTSLSADEINDEHISNSHKVEPYSPPTEEEVNYFLEKGVQKVLFAFSLPYDEGKSEDSYEAEEGEETEGFSVVHGKRSPQSKIRRSNISLFEKRGLSFLAMKWRCRIPKVVDSCICDILGIPLLRTTCPSSFGVLSHSEHLLLRLCGKERQRVDRYYNLFLNVEKELEFFRAEYTMTGRTTADHLHPSSSPPQHLKGIFPSCSNLHDEEESAFADLKARGDGGEMERMKKKTVGDDGHRGGRRTRAHDGEEEEEEEDTWRPPVITKGANGELYPWSYDLLPSSSSVGISSRSGNLPCLISGGKNDNPSSTLTPPTIMGTGAGNTSPHNNSHNNSHNSEEVRVMGHPSSSFLHVLSSNKEEEGRIGGGGDNHASAMDHSINNNKITLTDALLSSYREGHNDAATRHPPAPPHRRRQLLLTPSGSEKSSSKEKDAISSPCPLPHNNNNNIVLPLICEVCLEGDGDLFQCAHCQGIRHEACGGPHPPPTPARSSRQDTQLSGKGKGGGRKGANLEEDEDEEEKGNRGKVGGKTSTSPRLMLCKDCRGAMQLSGDDRSHNTSSSCSSLRSSTSTDEREELGSLLDTDDDDSSLSGFIVPTSEDEDEEEEEGEEEENKKSYKKNNRRVPSRGGKKGKESSEEDSSSNSSSNSNSSNNTTESSTRGCRRRRREKLASHKPHREDEADSSSEDAVLLSLKKEKNETVKDEVSSGHDTSPSSHLHNRKGQNNNKNEEDSGGGGGDSRRVGEKRIRHTSRDSKKKKERRKK